MSTDGFIPVAGPSISEKEVAYVSDAVRCAWYENAGIYHRRFQDAFAARIDRRFALALPSCTSALHLALAALRVGPGDEVIVPDLTWIASAAPIDYVGATAVFADVDPATWCLSSDTVSAVMTPRTRAVIAVDLYGQMPDYDRLETLCAERGVALIEDAAEAFGSRLNGREAGHYGLCGVFSLHGSKTISAGEGGVLVTDDEALFERVAFLHDHGRTPGDTSFRNTEVAFKYKMAPVQAALALAQLERADEILAHRRGLYAVYNEMIGGLDGVVLNPARPGLESGYWMITAQFDPAHGWDSLTLTAALREAGVGSRPFFAPLSSLDAYVGRPEAAAAAYRNQGAYALGFSGVNLPSAGKLTADDAQRAARAFESLITPPPPRAARCKGNRSP